jgi:hypothetical protein
LSEICYFHFYSLLKMQNAGLVNRLQARTLPAKVLPQYRDWATIGLAEVAPTVSIFVLGALVSVLLLALECCCAGGSERGQGDGDLTVVNLPAFTDKQFKGILFKNCAMVVKKRRRVRKRRRTSVCKMTQDM